ncbi:MAG: phenylalanine--tRNA ligase subunit beta [Alphaproteobacteria bacterium]
MKFSLSWLKDHLDIDAPLDEITDRLTALGLEVEEISDPAAELAAFKVAHVTKAEKHPDADKLQVCTVQTEDGEVQVVCGAPNARTGMRGVFAPVGSIIPGLDNLKLKKGKIRGVESLGMLVSEREMGLSDEHEGIIDLPEDAEIGTPLADALGLNDPIIEINLTPDRGDCAGVRGIARDLAASGMGKLRDIPIEPIAGQFDNPVSVTIDDSARDGCPMFIGRLIKGVKNGPSPQWLQDKLKAIGLKPISALVDLTNYSSFDRARPLHVFDADKLTGGITVRTAPGETLKALDEKEYTLDDRMVAICDDAGPQGIGGVMGGLDTGCTDETTNVYIECALFDADSIATTGQTTGIISDARYRFERGVDPSFALEAIEWVTGLVLEICGGEPSTLEIAGAPPVPRDPITLRTNRVQTLGGVDVEPMKQVEILTRLGFTVRVAGAEEPDTEEHSLFEQFREFIMDDSATDVSVLVERTLLEMGEDVPLSVTVPTWRPDVEGEPDLVEEILRVIGYDAIPAIPLPRVDGLTKSALEPKQQRSFNCRRALAAIGMNEAITWSFIHKDHAEAFGGAPEALTLKNPIISELEVMRPSLLPGLIAAAGRNAARGYPDVALFEQGMAFDLAEKTQQREMAAGLRAGSTGPRHWRNPGQKVDVFDAKSDVLSVLEAIGAPADNAQVTRDAPGYYHPGRSAVLRLGKNVLAQFGELHPAVLELMDVDGPMVGFEIFLENIPMPRAKGSQRKDLILPNLQALHRDFAFVVDEEVAAADLMRAAQGADKKLISGVSLFDEYRGKGIEEGRKSLAISVTLQPKDETLTDAQIEGVAQKVVEAVEKRTGGSLRG